MQHPSHFMDTALVDRLRSFSAEAEQLGQLTAEQQEILYRQQWFNLFVPRSFGGLELSLPEALRLQEALAWTDGSVGWTVTLCSGAAWFVGFLAPSAAREIFRKPKACLAGSGLASGTADVREGGYRVTGDWKHATGSPMATVFTALCVVQKDGVPLRDADGTDLVQAFWFHRHEVEVYRSWYSIGMVATASNSFRVQGREVPAERCFVIDPKRAVLPQPVYQYPFIPFAEATLAVNSSGMAIRFMDLCRPSDALGIAQLKIEEERTSFYKTLDGSWTELRTSGGLSPETISAVGSASRNLAHTSLRWVDRLYPLCGLQAADGRTEINRVWRNLHTASQHSLLRQPG